MHCLLRVAVTNRGCITRQTYTPERPDVPRLLFLCANACLRVFQLAWIILRLSYEYYVRTRYCVLFIIFMYQVQIHHQSWFIYYVLGRQTQDALARSATGDCRTTIIHKGCEHSSYYPPSPASTVSAACVQAALIHSTYNGGFLGIFLFLR